ncbi:MAG: UvrD-helicase domain-containing protein [Chloroflexi bacterium]|nr:UvrD-helicase domain-containing protein [Chloroflexota bacterium]MBT5476454.1 UvrD-helicase domain-containing protein [Chloroflexota bacterium]MBT7078539.1 UvrD-helicase domain-containing protein [Chloroflexota bacterium]
MPSISSTENLLADLSDRQREAVTHTDGPLLIVAGPGSGKTRVMAHRVAYLVGDKGVPPWKILAVTFTNKAARELRERCERLVGVGSNKLQVRTFHGFCSRVLRADGEKVALKPEFTIYDADDQARVARRILDDLDVDPKQFPPRSLLSVISDAKNNMRSPAQLSRRTETYRDEITARVYEAYEGALQRANAVDFDDLLLKTFQLLEGHPEMLEKYQERFEHLLVDEFQDTNALQFQVARLLAMKSRNICVVGDPDQSIYSWRHADPTNLTDFQSTFKNAKIVTLDQSYRSTQIILEAADSVISNNDGRMKKTLWTENSRGTRITVAEAYNEAEEASLVLKAATDLKSKDGIGRNEVAIMYRVNAQSRAFEVACNREGIPYRLVGGIKFYDRKEVKDILSFLRVVSNPADDAALERIINVPARGISARSVAELRRVAIANNVPALDVILDITRVNSGDEDPPAYYAELNTRAINSVTAFGDMITRFIEQSLALDTNELIDLIVERSGYGAMLREDKERGEERMENLQELKASAEQFAGSEERGQLTEFLENVALVSDVDGLQGGDSSDVDEEAITLITLHQAKGLEYDAVFLVGLEEGMLPHSRSVDDPTQLQEERRLLYVGMTRARKRLYMFRAFQRSFRGQSGSQMASRFLLEIPDSLVTTRDIRGHDRVADRMPDPMWTKRMASTPGPRPTSKLNDGYTAGEKVRHKAFGEGVVVSSSGVGSDTQVTVAFSGQGIKRLMLSFAPLEKVVEEESKQQFDPDEETFEIQDPELFAP